MEKEIMGKVLLLLFVSILASACGEKSPHEEVHNNGGQHKLVDGAGENMINSTGHGSTASKDMGFKKCSGDFAPFKGYYATTFYLETQENFPNRIFFNNEPIPYEKSFSDSLKALEFSEKDPCSQMKMFFSGYPFTQAVITMNLSVKGMDKHPKSGTVVLNQINDNMIMISNSSTSDNITSLPSHSFKVNIACQSGLKLACTSVDNQCDSSRPSKIEIMDDECSVEGVDQVFSLYPNGHVRVDFKGMLRKTGNGVDGIERMELVFSDVEWK